MRRHGGASKPRGKAVTEIDIFQSYTSGDLVGIANEISRYRIKTERRSIGAACARPPARRRAAPAGDRLDGAVPH
jgi:hypothetical protein